MQVSLAKKPSSVMSINQEYRRRLREIIVERSFSNDKEVTLSSGTKSNLYFNMKTTMLDNEGVFLLASLLLSEIPEDIDFVGGLEMGAVPIVSALCPVAFSNSRRIRTFFVRKKAKDHGAKKLVEGLLDNETLKGKRVAIVDDVTTTGGSVLTTLDALKDLGAIVAVIISIVDREEGARDLFDKHGIEFKSIFQASDFTN